MARFVDQAHIQVIAGSGGAGCVSFHRAKYVPKGGPDGGDGGRGGSIFFVGSRDVQTLLDFRFQPLYRAKNGEKGHGSQCNGRAAPDLYIPVPLGTTVREINGGFEADIVEHGQKVCVAKGGKGGLGNIHFKSSTHQAPRVATPGEPGEKRELELELRLISEVGIVGLPNAGKSSLLAALTSAHPKIGDYPFTTLSPQLGVLKTDAGQTALADIPGIIEGAHQGLGLGHAFLRHISRCSRLLILLSFDRKFTLSEQLQTIEQELRAYDPDLMKRARSLAINKIDLLDDNSVEAEVRELWAADVKEFKKKYPEVFVISALRKSGIRQLAEKIQEQDLKAAIPLVG